MAVIANSITRADVFADAWSATWNGLTTGDTGAPIKMVQANDRSVQVTGTFGAATVTIQGSNDGTNWFTLNSPQGTAMNFTAAGLLAVQEHVNYLRPIVVGGTTPSIVIVAFMRGQYQ